MQGQNLQDLLLSAISLVHNPASSVEQRKEAVLFIEQLKKGDAHTLSQVSTALISQLLPFEAQMAGYSLLTELIKNRWSELNEGEQTQLFSLACQNLASVCQSGTAVAWAMKSKIAVLLAATVRQKGAVSYNELLPQLLAAGSGNTTQAEVACMVLQYVSEDLTQFDTMGGDPKRVFLQSLTTSAPTVYPFLCQMLQQHFVAATECQTGGRSAEMQAHSAVISSALGALSTWVEWMPMAKIGQSNVLEACAYFLTAPEFNLQALDVLKAVASRKRSGDSATDYTALMDKLISLVLEQCQKQGLLPAGGATLSKKISDELDYEGSLEEFGKRLCSLLVVFGENHYRCIAPDRQLLFLQQMLAFSRHNYLLLSSLVLPMWGTLMRDALNMTHGGPSTTSISGDSSLPSPAKGSPITLPVEVYPAIMSSLAEQAQQVVVSCVDKSLNEFPAYFESHQEYKEVCSDYRGKVKNILRQATQLTPEAGLACVTQQVQMALLSLQDPAVDARKKNTQFESAVVVIEAAFPPLIDLAIQYPAAADGLESLLQSLLNVSLDNQITLIPLMAKALEAFGRFMSVRPHLVAPFINKCFTTMLSLPLEAHGHLPPPPRMSQAWRAYCATRIDMASALVALAKASPAAFAPHLEPLVVEILKLWDKGLLLEGERVLLWEGLLLASGCAGPAAQAQMVEGIFTPMHASWTSASFRQAIASPLAFVQHFLPIERVVEAGAQSDPSTSTTSPSYVGPVIGSRSERWSLYHQLTLLERSIRRTASPLAHAAAMSSSQADLQQQQQQPDHPFNAHLHWFLPSVGSLLHCVHGLDAVESQHALGLLGGITQMDPIEKALRSGEDVDSIKEQSEPRCIAGSALADARYFIRGIREACVMILSLSGQFCSAMWTNQQLASQLIPSVIGDLEGLEIGHLRLLLRHTLTPWALRCPHGLQQMWLIPLCRQLLPHMHQRLTTCWAAISSPSTLLGASDDKENKNKAASEEVVIDSLLREVTREHMSFLQALIRRPQALLPSPGAPSAIAAPQGPLCTVPEGAVSEGESALLDMLLLVDPGSAEAGMRTAVAGTIWPDAETAIKALTVCRYITNMALSVPSLEPFVCGEMLRCGIISLAQVFTICFQADVLALLRAIIVGFMLKGSSVAHTTLQELLQIPQQQIVDFEAQLRGLNSEKEQRAVIRQLVADSAGEEVRKMLASVAKINTSMNGSSAAALAVANEVQQKRKLTVDVKPEFDQNLSGSIYGMLFPDGQ